MAAKDPKDIVKTALAKGELVKLLLGAPEYQYRSRFSPAPDNTNTTELLAVIYDGMDPLTRGIAKDALEKALYAVSGTYEGIRPSASCILLETGQIFDRRPPLDLPIDDLARKLQATIHKFESRLRADKTGIGRDYPDGLYGDLRRLSRITVKYGGPMFCE